jgi:hypothetical protein
MNLLPLILLPVCMLCAQKGASLERNNRLIPSRTESLPFNVVQPPAPGLPHFLPNLVHSAR